MADSRVPLPAHTEIGVIGAGAMGAGIAQVAATAGHPTRLYDAKAGLAVDAKARIAALLERMAAKGRMSVDEARTIADRLRPAASLDDMRGAGLVIEAIVENLDVKRSVLAEVEGIVPATCILASNTSSISLTAIGAALKRPGRLAGMHFFNPAPLMELVEVINGLATDPGVAATILATAKAWGKVPVLVAKSTPGFIVNRVARPYYAEALRLLNEQAASPATIDAILRDAGGFRMGPFELMDLIGHDVNYAVTCSIFEAYYNDPRFTPSLIQKELVDAGRLGRKSGLGFYEHGGEAKPPAPAAEEPMTTPRAIVVGAPDPLNDALVGRLAGRVDIQRGADAGLRAGRATLVLADGRTATERAWRSGTRDTVTVDLALDFATASRVAVARAEQCGDDAYRDAAGALQAAGFAVSPIKDVPGMAVLRTVAMLANEAADAVNQGVCSAADVDMAMTKGVNYPRGPLAWAESIGIGTVHDALDNMARHYGESRYRVSPLIRQRILSGKPA